MKLKFCRFGSLLGIIVFLAACGGGAATEAPATAEPTRSGGLATAEVVVRATLPPAATATISPVPQEITPTPTRTPRTTELAVRNDATPNAVATVGGLPPDVTEAVDDALPTVGGGSGLIAFQSDRVGQFGLFSIDTNAANLRAITNDPTHFSGRPVYSPDGLSIAFTAKRGSSTTEDIYVLDLTTQQERRITNFSGIDRGAAWSPDGARLAYESDQDSAGLDIFTYESPGTITNLTGGEGNNGFPVWSPDGSRIAFISTRTGPPVLFLMNADGSNVVNTGQQGFVTSWSPDGRFLLLHREDPTTNKFDIQLVAVDLSSGQNLTNTPDSNESFAVFSPDGSYIAFHGDAEGNDEIYILPTGGGEPINLTNHFSNDRYPSWQPVVAE